MRRLAIWSTGTRRSHSQSDHNDRERRFAGCQASCNVLIEYYKKLKHMTTLENGVEAVDEPTWTLKITPGSALTRRAS
jgi:hypothetical protein